MKKRVFSFILILFVTSFSALTAQEWSDAIELGPGQTPDFDVDPETGNLHLIYNNGGGSVYTVLSPQGDVILKEDISRAAGENSWGGFHYGPSLAFDPTTGRPHVVYRRHRGNYFFDIYYTYKKADGSWSNSLQLMENTYRAYMVRLDVDSRGYVHILAGKSDGNDDIFGSATYYRIVNGNLNIKQENLDRYRADDRLEISISDDDILHIILSSPDRSHNGIAGGPVSYWRSADGGDTLEKIGDIHSAQAIDRNGNADIFADRSGNVHIAYGTAIDQAADNGHALRYLRFENGTQVSDLVVTDENELGDWQHSLGKGSVAASDNGQYVVMTYNQADSTDLRSRFSGDNGQTWSNFIKLAGHTSRSDGREKECLKAWQSKFYVVYPVNSMIYFRYAQFEYPPDAIAGGPYNATEGDTITFDASASYSRDGKDIIKYEWDWDNDGVFDETSDQPTTKKFYADDFSGTVALQVTDTDSLTGKSTFAVEIKNAVPVLHTGSPYRTIEDKPVLLKATVDDRGTLDTHTFSWDLDGDGTFETAGATVTRAYADSGSYAVKVKVVDDDGGEASANVAIEVGNSRPILISIPEQTIPEGGVFPVINLNQYASHANFANSALIWNVTGNSELLATIADSLAKIAVPDSEWAGSENLAFIATDPDGNSDTTRTKFTVTPVNDAPVFKPIDEQSAIVGGGFAQLDLQPFLVDADDAIETLKVSAGRSVNFFIGFVGFTVTIAPLNSQWIGSESVEFTVEDEAGASSTIDIVISVKEPSSVSENQNVIPDEFQLKMNYPNPFNPQTTIPFDLKEQGNVQLEIFDVTGRQVAVLISGTMHAGSHNFTWNAHSQASGTYFVVLRVRSGARQIYLSKQKMLLLR
ncbi:MAG: T9SS C-terminal target domain-containing protein [Calditrichaeota bacterium]|nr:MAG: T9SS C-terminal target domain-containing protein [Calditrichota bacterium]